MCVCLLLFYRKALKNKEKYIKYNTAKEGNLSLKTYFSTNKQLSCP